MSTNVFKKIPLGRIPYESTNFLDPDSSRKDQPGRTPIEGGYRGKQPDKYIDTSRKTVGVQMLAKNRYVALKVTRKDSRIATTFSRPFKLIDGNPILQLFISGPSGIVSNIVNELKVSNISIRDFDVNGPGDIRGPDIYRDRSVKNRGR